MDRINVTKTFLPPLEDYQRYVEQIWERDQLTNQGPLLIELQKKLESYLKVPNLHMVTNGTLALQIAIRALDMPEGEIITTPFSYVATTSSILWEHFEPVFVDIEPNTFCIDAAKIEAAITPKTRAIMPVHVFGFPCEVEKIDAIAQKHNLRVIYDAAHAFGVEYKGHSLSSYGDASILSFHATKLFHSIEGGAIITPDQSLSDKVELMKRFGHNGDEHYMLGMNAKASEFQAAMGLCNLTYMEDIIKKRRAVTDLYNELLTDKVQKPVVPADTAYNYAYYAIVMETEAQLLGALQSLENLNIFPRRYFYPSLNTLPYLRAAQSCPVSEDISRRIMCLPLYVGLEDEIVRKVCEVINEQA